MTATHILLDTGVLGVVIHPSNKSDPRDCKEWLKALLQKDLRVQLQFSRLALLDCFNSRSKVAGQYFVHSQAVSPPSLVYPEVSA